MKAANDSEAGDAERPGLANRLAARSPLACPSLNAPLVLARVVGWFRASGILEAAIHDGEMVPDFELPRRGGDGGEPAAICSTAGRW